ncbi:hypothetical protein VP1G_10745 [Cytospora mali]|uniref:Uncharacterized protein n=1 Tax=Cytospora mali TaxID=578113 RepID=A0A194UUC8_CYTMA|nr:hypothetical protein VP1G_10745 [Valsa mali var. pyri (nom. inval.)]
MPTPKKRNQSRGATGGLMTVKRNRQKRKSSVFCLCVKRNGDKNKSSYLGQRFARPTLPLPIMMTATLTAR